MSAVVSRLGSAGNRQWPTSATKRAVTVGLCDGCSGAVPGVKWLLLVVARWLDSSCSCRRARQAVVDECDGGAAVSGGLAVASGCSKHGIATSVGNLGCWIVAASDRGEWRLDRQEVQLVLAGKQPRRVLSRQQGHATRPRRSWGGSGSVVGWSSSRRGCFRGKWFGSEQQQMEKPG